MNSGLTINQEKKIRADKLNNPLLLKVKLDEFEQFAKVVREYRQAQKITVVGGTEVRRGLLEEIDKRLLALGL